MLLMSTFAFAQIQKGQVQLGGVFNYNTQDLGSGSDRSSFIFSPQAGYFFSDNTSAGISLTINSNSFEGSGFSRDFNLFEIGVFARFHKSVADNFYLFLQPSVGFGSGTDEDLNGDTDINTTRIQVSPGAVYFLSPKIALEMRIGGLFYESATETTNNVENDVSSFGISINPANVNFGVNFYL
ncbi:MAG: hypothetical protein Roseis2KO_47310 [Roseivirga sp.]